MCVLQHLHSADAKANRAGLNRQTTSESPDCVQLARWPLHLYRHNAELCHMHPTFAEKRCQNAPCLHKSSELKFQKTAKAARSIKD